MAKIHIRQSQVAHTYAAGSIGDFPGISVMFLTHDHNEDDWGKPKDQLKDDDSVNKRRVIIDKRLTDAFGIDNFVLPPIIGIGNLHLKVIRFPMSMYCPKCGRIYFATELEQVNLGNIPKINPPKTFDELLRAYYCLDCQEQNNDEKKKGKKNKTFYIELVPTRFIIANEEGFIDDFPWDWYVHRKPEKRKERGKGHKLYLEFGSSSASLGSISIISKDRNGNLVSRENLGDIFNQETTFIAKGDEYLKYVKNYMPKPWLGRDKDGYLLKLIDVISTEQIQRNNEGEIIGKNIDVVKRKYPKTLQRGANNLFFPLVFKGIRLPDGSNLINQELIIQLTDLRKRFTANQPDIYSKYSNGDWHKKFTIDLRDIFSCTNDELNEALNNVFPLKGECAINSNKKQRLRFEEFKCYTNVNIKQSKEIWFKARHIDVSNGYLKDNVKIEQITLLDKINELKIYRGFTRIRPLANEDLIFETDRKKLEGKQLDEYNRICDARKDPFKTSELPCAEVKGEGIFLKFNNEALQEWENKDFVQQRSGRMQENLKNYFDTFNIDNGLQSISARYVLLHTLSHIIMQQLAIDSGYNLSSLTEIIYCNKPYEEEQMNGILIYTSSSDSEGTLGGLVEKGEPNQLASIISKAVDKAKWCSSDPLCITSKGQGFLTTNMAACYSCVMVPETCCENINKFLDRKLVLHFFDIESL